MSSSWPVHWLGNDVFRCGGGVNMIQNWSTLMTYLTKNIPLQYVSVFFRHYDAIIQHSVVT